MSEARAAILARLRAAPHPPAPPPASPPMPPPQWTGEERRHRFAAALGGAHAEVHVATPAEWPRVALRLLAERGARRLVYAPSTAAGRALAAAQPEAQAVTLIPYEGGVEAMREALLHGVDAGLTTTLGGIAETGSLILWPTPAEPRLLSLLPPVHLALVAENAIHATLAEAMRAGAWAGGMPTNAVLISGPSKTADIEQTLAYGVHGPRELIVLVLAG